MRCSACALVIGLFLVQGFLPLPAEARGRRQRRNCCHQYSTAAPAYNYAPSGYAPSVGTAVVAPPAEKSLYERLGGEPAVKAVIDDFVGRAASNPAVNFTRKGTDKEWAATPENVAHLKVQLVNLVGALTGGPQKYEGKDMKSSHQGMQISNAEFDAIAGDLKATLDKFKVPSKEQNELLNIVSSTRGDIVEVQ